MAFTQQTEILTGMLAELRAWQAQSAANPAEPPADPNFNWARLVLPPETNFQIPGDGLVQRMASSLFARDPTLAGRDQHEARFVLQVISLWPDLQDEERVWVGIPAPKCLLYSGSSRMAGSDCSLRLNFSHNRLCITTGCSTTSTSTTTTPSQEGAAACSHSSTTSTSSTATSATVTGKTKQPKGQRWRSSPIRAEYFILIP